MYRTVSPNMHQRATNVHSLYATIRKTAGTSIVVDSSKYIHRFKLLHAQRPEQTRAIFLTRDGRSIVASKYKRQNTSATVSAKKWRRTNGYSRYILRNMPTDAYIHVRYEELCREPEAALARICEFAGISFDQRMLSLENIEAHNVGGNRMRMNPGKDIKEDRKWQSLLTESQLQQFETIAGEMNRLLLGQYHTSSASPVIRENTFARRHSD